MILTRWASFVVDVSRIQKREITGSSLHMVRHGLLADGMWSGVANRQAYLQFQLGSEKCSSMANPAPSHTD